MADAQHSGAHKQRVDEPVLVVPPALGLRAMLQLGTYRGAIVRGGETLATFHQPAWRTERSLEIRLPGRRLRFDRPGDQTLWERLGNGLARLVGMSRRRAVWRAGAGVGAEIEETSTSGSELSGRFTLDGDRYVVLCDRPGLLAHDFDRRLHDGTGLIAELEPNDAGSGLFATEYTIWPCGAPRLDALAIGVHMLFWLEASAGGDGDSEGGDDGGD